MNDAEPMGCLSAILRIFGIKLGAGGRSAERLPFRQRDDFLSAAEMSFFKVLSNALDDRAIICPKVNLADIFFVVRPNDNQSYRNRIDRKHVDFLICDPTTMKPRCGVELDDASHSRTDRQERDELVRKVFETAGLPLVRVIARAEYQSASVLSQIEPHLTAAPPTTPRTSSRSGIPICPKCGVPMLKRIAKKGPNAGSSFYGCPNYPRCRAVVNLA